MILPVGQEAEFKGKKDKLDLRVPEGNGESRKHRHYQVVAMKPISVNSSTICQPRALHILAVRRAAFLDLDG